MQNSRHRTVWAGPQTGGQLGHFALGPTVLGAPGGPVDTLSIKD